jgi:hypothetical protein
MISRIGVGGNLERPASHLDISSMLDSGRSYPVPGSHTENASSALFLLWSWNCGPLSVLSDILAWLVPPFLSSICSPSDGERACTSEAPIALRVSREGRESFHLSFSNHDMTVLLPITLQRIIDSTLDTFVKSSNYGVSRCSLCSWLMICTR